MKRVIVYFMFLWFLLLGGGHSIHANTLSKNIIDSPSWDFVTKHHVKVKTLESGSLLIEDADVDLDEEFHGGDNRDNTNNFALNKQNLFDNWYLTFSNEFIFRDYSAQIKSSTTLCGYSNPIYLTIGVFRI